MKNAGKWYVEDEPSVCTASSRDFREAIGEDAARSARASLVRGTGS